MNYLTFLSEQLFAVKPRIEAPLEGLWRLEETRQLDCRGSDELVYAYVPYVAENFCLDVRSCDASFFNDCRLCPGDAPAVRLAIHAIISPLHSIRGTGCSSATTRIIWSGG